MRRIRRRFFWSEAWEHDCDLWSRPRRRRLLMLEIARFSNYLFGSCTVKGYDAW